MGVWVWYMIQELDREVGGYINDMGFNGRARN